MPKKVLLRLLKNVLRSFLVESHCFVEVSTDMRSLSHVCGYMLLEAADR